MQRIQSATSESSYESRPSSSGHSVSNYKNEVDINSNESKHTRIAQRKSRIEANRVARAKPQQEELSIRKQSRSTIQELSLPFQQIYQSTQRLDSVKQFGYESVTNIMISAESREGIRRQEERKKQQQRGLKLNSCKELELQSSQVIEKGWEKAVPMTFPESLRALMLSQKKECDQQIDTKNKLLAEYVADLKAKDDEYVRELKKQTEEIDQLLQRMRTHYNSYQDTMKEEIEQIEKAFMAERTASLNENSKEIESLLVERRSKELKNMEEKARKLEDSLRALDELRTHDAEDYNVVKIKLETDIQVLEQQLQQMRATYQLNTEKLEYNYQVLKKRDDENMIVINLQKRKITKFTDVMNNLKARLTKQEKQYQQEYQNLTEEYKRITEQVKQLQKKFRHFQNADQKKFQDIWSMNEEEVKTLMRKVLQADQVIYEQQLGLTWNPPIEDLHYFGLDEKSQKSKNRMIETIVTENEVAPRVSLPLLASEEKLSSYDRSQDFLKQSVSTAAAEGFSQPVKIIMELLSKEASFLVESKLNQLLQPLQEDERSLMKLDSIFKALDIHTLEDVDRLTRYFISPEAHYPSGVPYEENRFLSILINPNDVVKAIKGFLEDSKERSAKKSDQGIKRTAMELLESSLHGDLEASLMSQKKYWQRMTNILSNDDSQIWDSVYQQMQKYHNLLNDRWKMYQEISSIKSQNDEMKSVLRQYLTAKVNDELQVPPTKVLLGQ